MSASRERHCHDLERFRRAADSSTADLLASVAMARRGFSLVSRFAGAACLLASLMAARPAAAEDVDPATRAAARALAYSGVEAYQRGDYAAAFERLDKALAALQAPSLALWSARALEKLGRLVEASERYRLVGRLDPAGGEEDVQRKAQQDAASELQALLPRIPSVLVVVEGGPGPQAAVTIDGTPVPPSLLGEKRPVNPGEHRIAAQRGPESAARKVTVREAEIARVVLELESVPAPAVEARPSAPPAPGAQAGRSDIAAAEENRAPAAHSARPGSGQRTAGWITAGIGGAALAVGAVTGLVALSKKSDFDSSPACSDNRCAPSEQANADSYNRLLDVSTAGFVAGGVLVAAGGVILLSAPKSAERVSFRLGPGGVVVKGAF